MFSSSWCWVASQDELLSLSVWLVMPVRSRLISLTHQDTNNSVEVNYKLSESYNSLSDEGFFVTSVKPPCAVASHRDQLSAPWLFIFTCLPCVILSVTFIFDDTRMMLSFTSLKKLQMFVLSVKSQTAARHLLNYKSWSTLLSSAQDWSYFYLK